MVIMALENTILRWMMYGIVGVFVVIVGAIFCAFLWGIVSECWGILHDLFRVDVEPTIEEQFADEDDARH
jgi:hypothetical protein